MEIGIDIGYLVREVNDGLYGFHVGNIFTPGALPKYVEESDDGIQWLIDLKPKSLRFPAGGSSKFMHLLPYRNIDGLPGLDPIKGYGYDIEEIIRYYDVTDNVIDIITEADYTSIKNDLADNSFCDNCITWMLAEDFRVDFEGFYSKWEKQESLSATDPSAIEQFVELVNDIETAHSGHRVDIILCLNIFSESAPQCQEIVRYLRQEELNEVAYLHVAGVELGNENYFKSSIEMLGMEDFEDYWSFVNGGQTDATWWTAFSDHVFSNAMDNDHDYIAAFKIEGVDVECKIGIPATNIDIAGYALKESGELATTGGSGDSWNELLRSKYSEKVEPGGPFSFDAVIIHPYYTAKDNYQDIAMLFDDTYGCPIFESSTFDSRLEPSFNGILGVTAVPLIGNFRDFIRTRYLESYDYHNTIFEFWKTTGNKKDLWTTEWNLLDVYSDIEGEFNIQERVDIYHNSFAGAFVLQEWWLQNVKLNYTRNFRTNFFTYSHFHNYHGTEYQNTLLLDADCADLKRYGLYPEYDESDRIYLRRTNYYVMNHLSYVAGQGLKYVRNNQYISSLNPNIQTTTFITPGIDSIYVYFTNIRPDDQHYIINGENMSLLFPDDPVYGPPIGVQLGNAFISCIDAKQPYSTSGKSTIYDLNTCYKCYGTPGEWHEFEIRAENAEAIRSYENIPACNTTPGVSETCVTVPGYSAGYFKIPVSPVYATPKTGQDTFNADLLLYPNPAQDFLTFVSHYSAAASIGLITHLSGVEVMAFDPSTSHTINTSSLPVGVYAITLYGTFGTISSTFIKQ